MVEQDYTEHITRVTSQIESQVEKMPTQPILFVGSGLTIRYADGPSWERLLRMLADRCPKVERDISYFLQRGDPEEEIGSHLAEKYYEWAYNGGRHRFDDDLYDSEKYDEDIFVKQEISKIFNDIVPDSVDEVEDHHQQEIELLKDINPHAVVTTNYDPLLELIFPDYEPIVGDQVLKSPHQNVGEIFKIHGCISEPEGLVFTSEDYDDWKEQKKYISAKLLTYFSEHPVLITGYGVGDDNIQSLLYDIDQILAPNDGVVDNIFFLKYEDSDDIADREVFESERRFDTKNGSSILLNLIIANGFNPVFQSFGQGGTIDGVNLKLLRSVMANTYDIVAKEAPREEIEINYTALKHAAESEDAVGTMFGVGLLDSAPDMNIYYRYRTIDLAEKLGYEHFNYVVQLLEQIENEKGVDIRDSDNQYHIDIAFNRSDSTNHRYSDTALELLRKVKNGEDYELDLKEEEVSLHTGEPTVTEAD